MLSLVKLGTSLTISLLLAFFTTLAVDKVKTSNDMLSYAFHYECLGSDFSSISACQNTIGSPP